MAGPRLVRVAAVQIGGTVRPRNTMEARAALHAASLRTAPARQCGGAQELLVELAVLHQRPRVAVVHCALFCKVVLFLYLFGKKADVTPQ
jgi:hypothetical protein